MSDRHHDDQTGRFVTKLTPEVHDEVIRNLASGAPVEVAAIAAGVVRQTFYNWMRQGRDAVAAANGDLDAVVERDPFARLFVEAERAQARYVLGALTHMTAIGQGKSQGKHDALGWILERRYPALFGKRSRLEVRGEVQHKHAIALDPGALEKLSPEQLKQLREIVAAMEGEVVEGEEPLLLDP